jgi:hypothetical protein
MPNSGAYVVPSRKCLALEQREHARGTLCELEIGAAGDFGVSSQESQDPRGRSEWGMRLDKGAGGEHNAGRSGRLQIGVRSQAEEKGSGFLCGKGSSRCDIRECSVECLGCWP